ncbi:MAG: 30S ribosomal protein S20 [Bradymonadales bacterium]|nr:30S ribosomal protein S20 [Bradymonadales bacterium]
MKRIRQNELRRMRNRHVKSTMRTRVRQLRESVTAGDAAEVEQSFKVAVGSLNRAASKGVIPKKRASRKVARLARLVNREK